MFSLAATKTSKSRLNDTDRIWWEDYIPVVVVGLQAVEEPVRAVLAGVDWKRWTCRYAPKGKWRRQEADWWAYVDYVADYSGCCVDDGGQWPELLWSLHPAHSPCCALPWPNWKWPPSVLEWRYPKPVPAWPHRSLPYNQDIFHLRFHLNIDREVKGTYADRRRGR